jgi:hypothetical protein
VLPGARRQDLPDGGAETREEVHLLTEHEVGGPARGDVRLHLAVRDDDLELAAEHSAGRVHALGREAKRGEVVVAASREVSHGALRAMSDLDCGGQHDGHTR